MEKEKVKDTNRRQGDGRLEKAGTNETVSALRG
jgi:hypothetical protein